MVGYRDLHANLMKLPNHCLVSPLGNKLTVALPDGSIVQISGENFNTMSEDEIRAAIKEALKK